MGGPVKGATDIVRFVSYLAEHFGEMRRVPYFFEIPNWRTVL